MKRSQSLTMVGIFDRAAGVDTGFGIRVLSARSGPLLLQLPDLMSGIAAARASTRRVVTRFQLPDLAAATAVVVPLVLFCTDLLAPSCGLLPRDGRLCGLFLAAAGAGAVRPVDSMSPCNCACAC